MNIRYAKSKDAKVLYKLGIQTPELRVSATEVFMDKDEFQWSLSNPKGVFLIAERKSQIAGFIYANADDKEKPFNHRYACLVYLVVAPRFRKQGVASKLYAECTQELKRMGVTHIYSWAKTGRQSKIIGFLRKQGLVQGHSYIWMDKKL